MNEEDRLKEVEKLLFQVYMTMNYLESVNHLPV